MEIDKCQKKDKSQLTVCPPNTFLKYESQSIHNAATQTEYDENVMFSVSLALDILLPERDVCQKVRG